MSQSLSLRVLRCRCGLQLEDLAKELALVQQQLEIERAVHATTAEFLKKLGGRLQDDRTRWAASREEDAAQRERELDVSMPCLPASRACHAMPSWDMHAARAGPGLWRAVCRCSALHRASTKVV